MDFSFLKKLIVGRVQLRLDYKVRVKLDMYLSSPVVCGEKKPISVVRNLMSEWEGIGPSDGEKESEIIQVLSTLRAALIKSVGSPEN